MRIEDGSQYSLNKQLADFLYFSQKGKTFAIECKATHGNTFPLARIGVNTTGGQTERLLDFYNEETNRFALIAFEFYGDCYRLDKRCYLADVKDIIESTKTMTIQERFIETIGIKCDSVKDLYDLSILDVL